MRVGVVGCGYWGSKHVRVLHGLAGVDEVAVIDPRSDRRMSLAQKFPGLRGFDDLPSALGAIDAVIIATPPTSHAALGLLAIRAGKHVLIEKPLATSTLDAQHLVAEAAAAGVTLMVGHTFEYNAAVWKLKEAIQDDELGNVHYIDAARLNLGLYQSDINVVWDLAPHDISIINYLLGATPTSVHAWGSSHAHAYLEDVAYLRMAYPQLGVTAQVHVSWLDPCKVRRVTVVGEQKMAVYNDLADEERVRIYDKGVVHAEQDDLSLAPASYRYGGISSPFIAFTEPLSVQDQHFVDCMTIGKRPQTDGENGVAVVQVLEAAQRSLREDRRVELDPFLASARH